MAKKKYITEHSSNNQPVFIYGLRSKDSSEYFYIGSTKNSLEYRLYQHLAHIRLGYNKNRHLVHKVNQVGPENVVIEALQTVSEEQRFECEYALIQDYIRRGIKLTNVNLSPDTYVHIAKQKDAEYEINPGHILMILLAYEVGLPRGENVIVNLYAELIEKLAKHIIDNHRAYFLEIAKLVMGNVDGKYEVDRQTASLCRDIFEML